MCAYVSAGRKAQCYAAPHVKTVKLVDGAKISGKGIGPITVSNLREAEYFAEAGFNDIIYAVSMVPAKLARAFNDGAGTECSGVLTHAGESYGCFSEQELVKAANHEHAAITLAAENIRAAGIACPIVSCDSTPTTTYATDLSGVTELRAGVYVFQDVFQVGLGSCSHTRVALSVLTTVISHKNNQNRIITDAGGVALFKDQSTRGTDFDCGYGLVADVDGTIMENLYVSGANQEHGIITTIDGKDFDFGRFAIGTKPRILPNHSCMTAAAYDQYNVIEGTLEISEVRTRCNCW